MNKNQFIPSIFIEFIGVNLRTLRRGIFPSMYATDLNFLEESDTGMIWIFISSFWRPLYFSMNPFNNSNRYLPSNGNLRFRIHKKYSRFDFNLIIHVSFREVVGSNCNAMHWDIFFSELHNVGNFSVPC